MYKKLCKGNCGNEAQFKGWCKIKWKSGNRFVVGCPNIENKRGKNISLARIKESKLGKNPMQNPKTCAKNHSIDRNKKCSETLKEKGRLELLPQQIESQELKDKRRKNVSIALHKLWVLGTHPRQLESIEKRRERLNKMANTLRLLGEGGKLPIQNMTLEQKKKFGAKISKKLIEGIRSGRIKLSKSWKRVPYKNLILRSNWERIVAEFLDKNNFLWEYESKIIPYFDRDRKKYANTIPDFYIPTINTIIEVKSNADFKSNKTEDKINGIKKKGFNTILVGRKEIELINKNPTKLLNQLITTKK